MQTRKEIISYNSMDLRIEKSRHHFRGELAMVSRGGGGAFVGDLILITLYVLSLLDEFGSPSPIF